MRNLLDNLEETDMNFDQVVAANVTWTICRSCGHLMKCMQYFTASCRHEQQ